MIGVFAFAGWVGVCALVMRQTAWQLPDGFGNHLALLQLVAAGASAGLVALGLPSAIDPRTRVIHLRGGRSRSTVWSRRKGLAVAACGIALFALATLAGWRIERGKTLKPYHLTETIAATRRWIDERTPRVSTCLGAGRASTCQLALRADALPASVRVMREDVTCDLPDAQACVEKHVVATSLMVTMRQVDTLAFAGGATFAIQRTFVGAPPPKAERE